MQAMADDLHITIFEIIVGKSENTLNGYIHTLFDDLQKSL